MNTRVLGVLLSMALVLTSGDFMTFAKEQTAEIKIISEERTNSSSKEESKEELEVSEVNTKAEEVETIETAASEEDGTLIISRTGDLYNYNANSNPWNEYKAVGGTKLTESEFEIVSCANNIKKRNATIIIKGKGNYGGTKTISFKIQSKDFLWWWRK